MAPLPAGTPPSTSFGFFALPLVFPSFFALLTTMTRLFALLSLVLVVAFSHAAPTSDERLHVLEANVAKQMTCEECVRAVKTRALTSHN